MDWVGPLSTLIGASIGVGSTLLADRSRFRRDRVRELESARRQIYARYLEALTSADSELQMLAVHHATPVDPIETRRIWKNNSVLALRYEVAIIAPPGVADAADAAYRRLRAIRNLIGVAGVVVGNPGELDSSTGSPEWAAVHLPYIKAIEDLQAAMREDIHG